MVRLQEDYSDGDVLYAGGDSVVSISNVNGITTEINTKLKYVGSDLVEGTSASSTAEVEIGTVLIAANTISSAIVIQASVSVHSDAGGGNQGTFNLKTGTDGSETTKESISLVAEANGKTGGPLQWVEDTLDWTALQSVSITGTNNRDNAGASCDCHTIIITGY